MSVTVIPLVNATELEIENMLADIAYDDAMFVLPDTIKIFHRRIATISGDIDTAICEIRFFIDRYGYRRVFFLADENQVFASAGKLRTREYITTELRCLGTSDLHYMDPASRGTYGYSTQTLTTDELNLRMEIIEGPLWNPIA